MGTIHINNDRVTVLAKPGRTLLAALTEGKVFIPSACGGQGKCGFCAIKIAGAPGLPLTAAEKTLLSPENIIAGYRLSCQIKTDSDLTVEIPEEYFSIRRFTGKVAARTFMTPDILNLHLQLLPGQLLEFKAGQYVQVRCPARENAPAVMRAYSLASAPSRKDRIELLIRRVNNGICTSWIFDLLKEGDLVQFSGPYGKFCLTCSIAPMIMIAGGSGMAPMLSILKEMQEKKIQRNIFFFFGARNQAELFKKEELRSFQASLPGLSFVPVLSNEPPESGWQGARGLVTDAAAARMKDLAGYEAYLCGSPGMVSACIKMLKSKSIPEDKIFYDKF